MLNGVRALADFPECSCAQDHTGHPCWTQPLFFLRETGLGRSLWCGGLKHPSLANEKRGAVIFSKPVVAMETVFAIADGGSVLPHSKDTLLLLIRA